VEGFTIGADISNPLALVCNRLKKQSARTEQFVKVKFMQVLFLK
jgi:hypothetical protein